MEFFSRCLISWSFTKYDKTKKHLHNPIHIHIDIRSISLWELLAPDIQRIKSVRAIGAMLLEILFGFRQLFTSLLLVKTVTATFYASCLNSENEIIIVLAVEERH